MKRWLLTSVAALGLTPTASAADLTAPYKAPPAVSSWAGFYLGIDGGIARHDAYFNDLGGFSGSYGSRNTAQTGGVLGGYAGYNWQDRSFVYGLEADANWIGAKAQTPWGGSAIFVNSYPQSQDVPWVATFRGRLGIDLESTLLYLTGGLAVGKVQDSFDGVCPANGGCRGLPAGAIYGGFSENASRLGWTAGAGFEHMFDSHVTLRGEIRYVDLGRSTVACSPAVALGCSDPTITSYRGEFSNTLMSGLVGLGYKF
jgi:outer membrane immunogenic protein